VPITGLSAGKEGGMNIGRLGCCAVALAAFVLTQDAGLARTRHKVYQAHPLPSRCIDRPAPFSWGNLLFGNPQGPNGCAPPVYQYGRYVGQDPDPFIRQQLMRDPATGAAVDFH
jgi:hypothetical protein